MDNLHKDLVDEDAAADMDDPFAMMAGMGEEDVYKVTLMEDNDKKDGEEEEEATVARSSAATCPSATDIAACAVSPAALAEVLSEATRDEAALQCHRRMVAINQAVGAAYKVAQHAIDDIEAAAATSKAAAWRRCEALWTVAFAVGEAAAVHWEDENDTELRAAIQTASFALDQVEVATGSAKPAAWAVCDVHWAAALNTTMFSGVATDEGAVDTVQQAAMAVEAAETAEVAEAADGQNGSKQTVDGEAAMVTDVAETKEVAEVGDNDSKQTANGGVALPAASTATASQAATTSAGLFDIEELDGIHLHLQC